LKHAVTYAPFDPDEGFPQGDPDLGARLGAAEGPWRIAEFLQQPGAVHTHEGPTVDGFTVSFTVEVLP
jgi:hypothetical protein